jgi:hypothetical protein
MADLPFVKVVEVTRPNGIHAHLTGLLEGWCTLTPKDEGRYLRKTQFRSKHGRRIMWHPNYKDAVAAAIAWAKRRNLIILRERRLANAVVLTQHYSGGSYNSYVVVHEASDAYGSHRGLPEARAQADRIAARHNAEIIETLKDWRSA